MNESILNTLSENNPRGRTFGFYSQDYQGKNLFIKLDGEKKRINKLQLMTNKKNYKAKELINTNK